MHEGAAGIADDARGDEGGIGPGDEIELRAQGAVNPGESVVLVLTGHTLKDADYTIDFHRGTLLGEEEKSGLEAQIDGLRRNAQVVDATPAAVLAALKGSAG